MLGMHTGVASTSRPDLSVTIQSHRLIAKFLQSQGYNDTLAAFQREASQAHDSALDIVLHPSSVELLDKSRGSSSSTEIPPTTTNVSSSVKGGASEVDLREVVESWLSSRLAGLSTQPAPLEIELSDLEVSKELPTKVTRTVRDSTNVLGLKSGKLPRRRWDSEQGKFVSEFLPCIFSTAVDRTIKIYETPSFEHVDTHQLNSPVLSLSISPNHHGRFLVAGTMQGSLHLLDLVTRKEVMKLKNHNKYIVKTAWSRDGHWVTSIGYDRLLIIYEVTELPPESVDADEELVLLDGEEADELHHRPNIQLVERFRFTTKTNPEATIFLPDSKFLVFSNRDDYLIHYLEMRTWKHSTYNLNENKDHWCSFSVLSMSLHPHLPILCLQTSTENSRLILYPFHSDRRLLTLFTTALQSDFTTPRHDWCPDGSAVIVNSEDGILRVINLKDQVIRRIGAHGIASPVDDEEGNESLVSDLHERNERLRARREAERGSSVIKDVIIIVEKGSKEEDEDKWVFVSCGFDKTIRVCEG